MLKIVENKEIIAFPRRIVNHQKTLNNVITIMAKQLQEEIDKNIFEEIIKRKMNIMLLKDKIIVSPSKDDIMKEQIDKLVKRFMTTKLNNGKDKISKKWYGFGT